MHIEDEFLFARPGFHLVPEKLLSLDARADITDDGKQVHPLLINTPDRVNFNAEWSATQLDVNQCRFKHVAGFNLLYPLGGLSITIGMKIGGWLQTD